MAISNDEYITITTSSTGVNASCSILTNGSNIVAYLNNIEFSHTEAGVAVLSESYWTYEEEERPKITYDNGPSFFVADPDVVEGHEYTIMISYNVYVDGVCVGFDRALGAGVTVGNKYPDPDPDPGELTNPPTITQIWYDHFPPDGISINFMLDTSNCADSYDIEVWIEDRGHNKLLSYLNDEISNNNSYYFVYLDKDEIGYGSYYACVQISTSSGESCLDSISFDFLFQFSNMYNCENNNAVFDANEWNEYRKLLSRELSNRGYTYNYTPVSLCDSVTPDTFNEPINAYYNAFGTYYEGVEPITGFYFGDYSGDSTKISAREFIQRLASMLNSLF